MSPRGFCQGDGPRSGRSGGRALLLALIACWAVIACRSGSPGEERAATAMPSAPTPAQTTARSSPDSNSSATATPAPAAGAPQRITLALPAKSLAYLPYYVGLSQGLYTAEGIDLELVLMPSNLAIAAMAAGELAYTGSSGSSSQASVGGQPFKVVLIMARDLAFTLSAAPEIMTVADLRGRTAAVTALTATDEYTLRAILRGQGVSSDEVTAVATQTTANSLAALTSGAVQAAVLSPPFDVQAERLGFRPLAEAADYLHRPQSGLATTDRQLAERPAEVQRLIRATLRSIAYAIDSESATVEFVTAEFGVASDLARATYARIARVLSRDGEAAPEALREEIEDAKARLGIGGDVPLSQVADFALLQRARRELGPR